MIVDCQWIKRNLEAVFCDSLNPEEKQFAPRHIETCVSCRKEMDALHAVDPLIKKHFLHQLQIARRPRVVQRGRVFGLSAAALTLVAIFVFSVLRVPQSVPNTQPQPQVGATVSFEAPVPAKDFETDGVERAKPVAAPDRLVDHTSSTAKSAVPENAPDFLVTDLGGYSHTIGDYRGHVVVITVWSPKQIQATANIERLYKMYGAIPKFRFLDVANDRSAKTARTTVPLVYNHGSKVFGVGPGEFVLINEAGAIKLRGNLVKDFDTLRKALQGD